MIERRDTGMFWDQCQYFLGCASLLDVVCTIRLVPGRNGLGTFVFRRLVIWHFANYSKLLLGQV